MAFRQLIDHLTQHLKELDRQVKELERQIIAWHRSSELSRKLEKITSIGPLAASALGVSIADASTFDNGRQVSAWLGPVPRQSSSGGKSTLLGMSKRGDAYLRTLLIHGARSAILAAIRNSQNASIWLTSLLTRRHANIAAVALANKNARTVDITVDATTAGKRRLNPVDPKAFGSRSNHLAESMRNVVQAAAANTNTFATMTGDALISTPYITQSSAPNIWTPRSSDGRTQKYDPTNTAVAPHPKYSVPE